jgi:hypothetical protein
VPQCAESTWAESPRPVAVRSCLWIDAGGPIRNGGWRLAWQRRKGGRAVDRWRGGGPVRLRAAERRWIDSAAVDQRAPCG